jgi:chemotaxis regulatin CheY-phosphate phosphatase CheZ
MSLFDQWMQSGDDAIKNSADMVDQATNQYNAKQISLAEYRELCSDILDYQNIAATISDLNRRQAIWDAFQAITTIVNAVSGL